MADPTANLYAWLGIGPTQTAQRLAELEALFAEDATFVANGVTVGTSRTAIMAAVRSVTGWLSHNALSISANAAFLAGTYRNDYADGTSSNGCVASAPARRPSPGASGQAGSSARPGSSRVGSQQVAFDVVIAEYAGRVKACHQTEEVIETFVRGRRRE